MTRRELMTTAVRAGLLAAGALALSGCGGESQPARGSISTPRQGGAESTAGEKARPKAATKGKPGGRGGP